MTRPVIELSKQVTEARYFSFRRQGGRLRTPVDVIFGGREHCSPEYAINRKGFPVYLLEYVEEGAASWSCRGNATRFAGAACISTAREFPVES
jgi:hypothetical protein